MKKNCILTYIEKNLLLLFFLIVFNQNASIKENILKPKSINLTWSDELNLLFNKKLILQTVVGTLWLGLTAFLLKKIFFSDEQKKTQEDIESLKTEQKSLKEKNIELQKAMESQFDAIKQEKKQKMAEEESDSFLKERVKKLEEDTQSEREKLINIDQKINKINDIQLGLSNDNKERHDHENKQLENQTAMLNMQTKLEKIENDKLLALQESNKIAQAELQIKIEKCTKEQIKENENNKFNNKNRASLEALNTELIQLGSNQDVFFEQELERIKSNNEYNLWDSKNIIYHVMATGNLKKWINPNDDGDKNYMPTPDMILVDPKIKTTVNKLILMYKDQYQKIQSFPELHPVYNKNKPLIKSIIDKYQKLCLSLKEESLLSREEKIYNNIILYNDSLNDKVLFENALEILDIKNIDNDVLFSDIYLYLSKADKVILQQLIIQLNKEKQLRARDSSRQYQWWSNDVSGKNVIGSQKNKEIIKKYQLIIQKLYNQISNLDVQNYEEYEKYEKYQQALEIGDPISLLVTIDASIKIKDNEKEIINFLLDSEFKKFEVAMMKENKLREDKPERHSIYQTYKEQIDRMLNYVNNVDVYIQSIDESTAENREYEDLFNKIDWSKDYSEINFFSVLANSVGIDFKNVELRDILLHLSWNNKNIIRGLYNNLIIERQKRGNDKLRKYKWYINRNKEDIDLIKKKIANIGLSIKNNDIDDDTYEKYSSVLMKSINIEIVNTIINDLKCTNFKVFDILSCFDRELQELKEIFNQETNLREECKERCYKGKQNKNIIENYNTQMIEFFKKLSNDTIDEKTNNNYKIMARIDLNSRDRDKIFFIQTSQLFGINFSNAIATEIFEILSFDNKKLLNSNIELIQKEIQLRSIDKRRDNQWYVNDCKLQKNIEVINQQIKSFIQETENNNVFKDKQNETIYLKLIQYIENDTQQNNYTLIKLLFEIVIPMEEDERDALDYNNLTEHINIVNLMTFVRKEKEKRLSNPSRSYYYKDVKENIEKIMTQIKQLNIVMGNDSKTTNQDVNNFFKFVFEEKNLDSVKQLMKIEEGIKLFFNLCKEYCKIEKNNDLWCFLSMNQIEDIKKLICACKKEKELRKSFSSRGLSDEDKKVLCLFRKWLDDNIYNVLAGQSLTLQEEVLKMCGNEALVLQKDSLYRCFLELYYKLNKQNVESEDCFTLVKYLDQRDKDRIEGIQKMLETVVQTTLKQKEDLIKEKRILNNVVTCDRLDYKPLIIDDDAERGELMECENKKRILKDKYEKDKNDLLEEENAAREEKEIQFKEKLDELKKERDNYINYINNDLINDILLHINYYPENVTSLKKNQGINKTLLQILGLRMLLHYDILSKGHTELLQECFKINDLKEFNHFFFRLRENLKDSESLFSSFSRFESRYYNKYFINSFLYLCVILCKKCNNNYAELFSKMTLLLGYEIKEDFILDNKAKLSSHAIVYLVHFVLNYKLTKSFNEFKSIDYNLLINALKNALKEDSKENDLIEKVKNDSNLKNLIDNVLSLRTGTEPELMTILKNIVMMIQNSQNISIFKDISIDEVYIKEIQDNKKKLNQMLCIVNNFFMYPFIKCDRLKKGLSNIGDLVYSEDKETEKKEKIEDKETEKKEKIEDKETEKKEKIEDKEKKIIDLITRYMPLYMQCYYKNIAFKYNSLYYYDLTNDKEKESAYTAKKKELEDVLKYETEQITKKFSSRQATIKANFERISELISLEKKITELKNKLIDKKKGNKISQESLTGIPEDIIKYSFIVKISNKILQLIQQNDELLEAVLKQLKDSNAHKEEEELKEDDEELILEQLFHSVSIIESIEDNVISIKEKENLNSQVEHYCCFLNSIRLKASAINSVSDLKDYLRARLSDDYNVEQNRAHFVFNGSPGTGKTAFIKFSIYKLLEKYSTKLKLHSYLKKNIILFNIAKSSYSNGLNTIESGLSDDINTILKAYTNPILFVQMDEIDDLVRTRLSANDAQVNSFVTMALTLMDSQKIPFSLIGTTNLKKDEIDIAIMRAGRATVKEFEYPSTLQIKQYLSHCKSQFELLISKTDNNKYNEQRNKKLTWINQFKEDSVLEKFHTNLKNYLNKPSIIYLDVDRAMNEQLDILCIQEKKPVVQNKKTN